MKLVELLAKELKEWPEPNLFAWQDEGGEIRFNSTIRHDFQASSIAEDCQRRWHEPHPEPVVGKAVTRAQWQAERDRQKGGEWKRHRGGKCPVHGDQQVEVKLRDGDIQKAYARCFAWPHDSCDTYANIMQYRVISQPQAEEVEVKESNECRVELSYDGVNFKQIGTARIDSITDLGPAANPLTWRDTIIHCQAIIEDCEREIERNVDLLDAEGLMMQTDSKKAMQHYVPDVEPKDWKIGDILEITKRSDDNSHDFKIGEQVKIDFFDLDDEDLPVRCYAIDDSDYWYIKFDEAKFIRRP